ncbi:hypothetical protein ABFS83_11G064100 [Erythranthe nasuta]
MGESSPCLVRSFSQPSPTSSEDKKGNNPLQRALTTSVSFGRFMSESLDWEKWSSFTQNRHLEEVERYSKPGSVAEKKAYFEAHFKRRRAAALLEQQIAEANDLSETNSENKVEDNINVVTEKNTKEEEEIQNNDPVFPVAQSGSCDENPVELTNHLENNKFVDDIVSKKVDTDDSATEKSASSSVKKIPSVKPIIMPVQLKNSEKTPHSKSNVKDLSNKRRSYTTSLHMSINFASCSGETRKVESPIMTKIANATLVRAPAKKYKNNLPPQTSTRASVNGILNPHSAIPPTENKRTIIADGNSISRSRTVDAKVQSPCTKSTNYSKSSSTFGSKPRLPSVSSSFTLKSEERAEKRREFFQKLEQKSKPKDTEKQQQLLHAKSQVRRSYSNGLRNSIASKATKDGEAPTKVELPTNLTKKIPSARPKIEERAALKVQDNDTRPRWNLSVKPLQGTKDITLKNSRPPNYSAKFSSKKSSNENSSPNIQQL